VIGVPPAVGATDVGDTEQVAGAAIVHERLTVLLYPFRAAIVPFQVTFWAAIADVGEEVTFRVKSG
jgi:hypothetical protein